MRKFLDFISFVQILSLFATFSWAGWFFAVAAGMFALGEDGSSRAVRLAVILASIGAGGLGVGAGIVMHFRLPAELRNTRSWSSPMGYGDCRTASELIRELLPPIPRVAIVGLVVPYVLAASNLVIWRLGLALSPVVSGSAWWLGGGLVLSGSLTWLAGRALYRRLGRPRPAPPPSGPRMVEGPPPTDRPLSAAQIEVHDLLERMLEPFLRGSIRKAYYAWLLLCAVMFGVLLWTPETFHPYPISRWFPVVGLLLGLAVLPTELALRRVRERVRRAQEALRERGWSELEIELRELFAAMPLLFSGEMWLTSIELRPALRKLGAPGSWEMDDWWAESEKYEAIVKDDDEPRAASPP